MENCLPLFAGILCAVCAVPVFISGDSKKVKIAVQILWTISAAAIILASALMIILQVSGRFEYKYVFSHIKLDMAVIYKISALWSGQEGSFLLWAAVMAVMGFFVLPTNKNRDGKAFGIYALISMCVFIMCFVIGPFQKTATAPPDGLGLNAALKDPWMTIHPPLVFISYGAMAILFSLSATVHKTHSSKKIALWLRISWIFLGAGILSGSIWAYRALGWGGFWAWDPIENAALVPWLIICVYLHNKKFDAYPVCIVPFSVACFGAFVARSGALENLSVHAYSDGNTIVLTILLCFIIGAALYLVIAKIRGRKSGKQAGGALTYITKSVSYAIFGYAALIFLGTVAPVFLKAETPTAYFTAVSVIFAVIYNLLLLFNDLDRLKKRGLYMAVISTAFVIAVMALSRSDKFGWLMLLWLCFMPLSLWLASGFPNGWKYHLIHLGISLIVIGAVASSALCGEGYAVAPHDGGRVDVSGADILLTELLKTDVVIKTSPINDVIVRRSQITDLAQDGYLISYVTKPLIILFWIGGTVAVAAPVGFILSEYFIKRKQAVR